MNIQQKFLAGMLTTRNLSCLIIICCDVLLIWLLFLQGAGQDVGRSCIIVSIGGKNIMLDCGMHMGFNDDVSLLCQNNLDSADGMLYVQYMISTRYS